MVQGSDVQEEVPEDIIERAFARVDGMALGVAIGSVLGVLLFVATAVLLLRGGDVVGPNLSLLAIYFWGFAVTWKGAFVALVEGGIGGFFLGGLIAGLHNWGVLAYADMIRRQAMAEQEKKLLEKI